MYDAKENTKLNERVDAFCLLLKENNIDIRSYNLNLYGKEKTTTK